MPHTPSLVGGLFRATIPYAGAEHPVHFRVLAEDEHGALRVRTVPLPSDTHPVKDVTAWVSLSELSLLVRCELIELLGHVECTECGGKMELVDGAIQAVDESKPRDACFLACTECENCSEL